MSKATDDDGTEPNTNDECVTGWGRCPGPKASAHVATDALGCFPCHAEGCKFAVEACIGAEPRDSCLGCKLARRTLDLLTEGR